MNDDKLLTRDELAVKMQISTRTIMRLEKEGLPVMVIGDKTIRYNYTDVVKWLKEHKSEDRNETPELDF